MRHFNPKRTDHYTIVWNDTKLDGKISLMALCSYFQESAWHHAEHLGYGFDKLKDSKQGWVLMKLYLEIEEYPEWADTIMVETWPTGVERIFARRDFIITDKEEKRLATGVSWWLIIDLETRRPKPVESLKDFNYLPRVMDILPERIRNAESMETLAVRKVEYSELDQLEHVSNTRYAGWIENALGRKWFETRQLHTYYIEFISEVLENDVVVIKEGSCGDMESIVTGCREEDGKDLFKAKITWEEINRE